MINAGERVRYIPINYLKRSGSSKIRPVHDFLNFMRLITKLTLYFNPMRIFSLISLVLLFSAFGIFSYCKYYYLQIPDILLISLIFTGITTFNLGLLADLINNKIRFR